MNKQKALDAIAEEIKNCDICKENKVGVSVPGEGNPDADIVFLGEAPGKQEAECGRPFIGRSGKLLRATIRSVGLKEEDVYITSPVKYLPVHITPKREEIAHGRVHLYEQLKVINPKIIVLLGNTATIAMLDQKIPVLQRHGEILKQDNLTFFLTIHPAAAIRFVKFKKVFEEDFKKLKDFLQISNN